MAKTQKQIFGQSGESAAACYLQQNGYRIVGRNYAVRGGEIDIIAWHTKQLHGTTLCFIEVKTRKYSDGSAERATDWAKLRRICRAARMYCIAHTIDLENTPIQFEQVSVCGTPPFTQKDVTHYIIPIS